MALQVLMLVNPFSPSYLKMSVISASLCTCSRIRRLNVSSGALIAFCVVASWLLAAA